MATKKSLCALCGSLFLGTLIYILIAKALSRSITAEIPPVSNEQLALEYQRRLYVNLTNISTTSHSDVHVIYYFVDHFEPGHGEKERRVHEWATAYPRIASQHHDSDGRHPKHTFFWLYGEDAVQLAPEDWQLHARCLETICTNIVYPGYGEVELHVHHWGRGTESENAQELMSMIDLRTRFASRYGVHTTAEESPRHTFGFIHGRWALDNSWLDSKTGRRRFCGVSNELAILPALGCYADFTFPTKANIFHPSLMMLGISTPYSPTPFRKCAIFYAKEDGKPKSYDDPDNIREVEVGGSAWGDLMLIQGPLDDRLGEDAGDIRLMTDPSYATWFIYRLIFNRSPLVAETRPIRVGGRAEWLFIRNHTHGVNYGAEDKISPSTLHGKIADRFYSEMEALLRDKPLGNGKRVRLHYVTAREAYNLVKAAEAGMRGNPAEYRNFVIPPYASNIAWVNKPWRLHTHGDQATVVELLESSSEPVDIRVEGAGTRSVYEGRGGKWVPTDAVLSRRGGEMRVADATPSPRYCFGMAPEITRAE